MRAGSIGDPSFVTLHESNVQWHKRRVPNAILRTCIVQEGALSGGIFQEVKGRLYSQFSRQLQRGWRIIGKIWPPLRRRGLEASCHHSTLKVTVPAWIMPFWQAPNTTYTRIKHKVNHTSKQNMSANNLCEQN